MAAVFLVFTNTFLVEHVLSFMTPIQSARVSRVSREIRTAHLHHARYVRPQKMHPEHLHITSSNSKYIREAHAMGYRSFTLETTKIPPPMSWFYAVMIALANLSCRAIRVQVWRSSYREYDNRFHDARIIRMLEQREVRASLESLSVQLVSSTPFELDFYNFSHLKSLTVASDSSYVVGLPPSLGALRSMAPLQLRPHGYTAGLVRLESTVTIRDLGCILRLPSLRHAILRMPPSDVRITTRDIVCYSKTLENLQLYAATDLNIRLQASRLECVVFTAGAYSTFHLLGTPSLRSARFECGSHCTIHLGGARVDCLRSSVDTAPRIHYCIPRNTVLTSYEDRVLVELSESAQMECPDAKVTVKMAVKGECEIATAYKAVLAEKGLVLNLVYMFVNQLDEDVYRYEFGKVA